MKHNTHIYLASKAIEFLTHSVDNLRTSCGASAPSKSKSKARDRAKELQRLLRYHQSSVVEACWAPDDVLCDKSLFHTFKLFTDAEFAGAASYAAETHERGGVKYYRIKGGGGLAYKVDHLARVVADIAKLRGYNDHFTQRQVMYLYLMISHYVADAHVPMHCDVRDDPPSAADTTKPQPLSAYYTESLHGSIEDTWDKACTPVAMAERIMVADTYEDYDKETALSPQVRFSLESKADRALVRPVTIGERDMMTFMVDICVAAKLRSLKLFPVESPKEWNQADFPALTRDIFADTIGNLISVWLWMWGE
jgi:hypothetical protein